MRVRFALRVEVPAGAHAVARAAIALLVDVEAVLLPGLEATDVRHELDLVALLGEGRRALYAAVLVRLQRGPCGRGAARHRFHHPAPGERADDRRRKRKSHFPPSGVLGRAPILRSYLLLGHGSPDALVLAIVGHCLVLVLAEQIRVLLR